LGSVKSDIGLVNFLKCCQEKLLFFPLRIAAIVILPNAFKKLNQRKSRPALKDRLSKVLQLGVKSTYNGRSAADL